MPSIDPNVMTHRLSVDSKIKPTKQRRQNFAPKRNAAMAEEVDKLMLANFIQEVQYPN